MSILLIIQDTPQLPIWLLIVVAALGALRLLGWSVYTTGLTTTFKRYTTDVVADSTRDVGTTRVACTLINLIKGTNRTFITV